MSGPKTASYGLSRARRRELAEQQRLRAEQRRRELEAQRRRQALQAAIAATRSRLERLSEAVTEAAARFPDEALRVPRRDLTAPVSADDNDQLQSYLDVLGALANEQGQALARELQRVSANAALRETLGALLTEAPAAAPRCAAQLDNELVHLLPLPRPHYEDRRTAAAALAPAFTGHEAADEGARADFAKTFANLSEGMSLRALLDITQMARAQRLGFAEIADAVRSYQVGTLESPWKRDYLRERIGTAEAAIGRRVKGQPQAVSKTVDILIRSVMGLTGAPTVARSGRPRGVLFFAGPTGVGKTELAKALTQVLFSDERAYIRFDMSEFAAEHADARLLGAPPGYVGYEAGGELTNALRERPFSVLLFDEIEKAHPRVLDKFLQILEDGRITDGRGNTVYFSESLIVFTSNLGIYVPGPDGGRIQNVAPGDPYAQVESKVRQAIDAHFKYQLNRPEILNRIGDNIVVFDFIAPGTAAEIFAGMLENVRRRVREEHGIELEIAAQVREQLRDWCTADLSNGGRGIGNRLESVFVNPLGRALFAVRPGETSRVKVADITLTDQVYAVRLA